MGPPHDGGLRLPLLGLLLLGLAGGLGLWAAPQLARRVVGRGAQAPGAPVQDAEEVDAFLARALPEAGAARALDRVVAEGVLRATWQLAPGKEAAAATQALQAAARAAGIELHARPRDVLDAEVRVYAGPQLRQELRLVPDLPAPVAGPPPPNRRERPLLALVVAGLGAEDAAALAATPVPLTLALRPWTPFALPTARVAARAWQEVLVDLGEGPDPDPAAALAAVPYASGVLLRAERTQGLALPPDLDRPVVLAPDAPPAEAGAIAPWWARDRGEADLRARIAFLLARDGATAVVLEHDAPALPGLLAWAAAAPGLRLVLASEVSRPADVIGLRDADNPRAVGAAP